MMKFNTNELAIVETPSVFQCFGYEVMWQMMLYLVRDKVGRE